MNNFHIAILAVIWLSMALFGLYMWWRIIGTICRAKDFDVALYEKWGSPIPSGYLNNPKDQISIIFASFEIVFTNPKKITKCIEYQMQLSSARKLILAWNVILFVIGSAVVLFVFQIRG